MNFFQGSTTLNFIPFCLENKITVNPIEPTISQVDNPYLATVPSSEAQAHSSLDHSPHSQDSEPDVTAYAESVIRRMESILEGDQITTELSAGSVLDENQSYFRSSYCRPHLEP